MLNVGDIVSWKGAWGNEEAELATVTSIECNCEGKSGDDVTSIPWSDVTDRSVIVGLDNNHWAYGNQITEFVVSADWTMEGWR